MGNKIVLICPSNLCYSPYVRHYLDAFKKHDVGYDILYWDRFNLNENKEWVRYSDRKIGHRRDSYDYLKFSRFVKKTCSEKKYARAILFTVPLAFFLSDFFRSKYIGKYVWDVRDYHLTARFFNLYDFVRSADFVAISSPGFREWLPDSNNYHVCHNISRSCYEGAFHDDPISFSPMIISYIGGLRDYEVNSSLVRELAGSRDVMLEYHGQGIANGKLSKLIKSIDANNITMTGHFDPINEHRLYAKASIINAIIPPKGINNLSLLPNRLYQSILHQRPLLAIRGTRTATMIRDQNLGLVLDRIKGCEIKILEFAADHDRKIFLQNSSCFLSDVEFENEKFRKCLTDFMDI